MRELDLFGEEVIIKAKRTKQEVFEDYESFCKKFDKSNTPRTTDECYTPQCVYDAVVAWVGERVSLEGRPIVRPFYPGGDYVNYEYPENCVVIDNPPFSILAEIIRFYLTTKIDYFLFAPGLTMFGSSPAGDCNIVASAKVIYANNADVNTSFHTSLFPGTKVLVASSLSRKIHAAQFGGAKTVRKRSAPPYNLISSALLHKYTHGDEVERYDNEVQFVRKLDYGGPVFGGGVFHW